MDYKLKYLPEFTNDMNEINDYISINLENPSAAFKLTALVKEKCEHLKEMPRAHHLYQTPVPLEHEYRILSVNNYSVFYTVDDDNALISIHRILYNRQDFGGSIIA
ncbi:MAG: type II toxin-antitoxin system RelE/ParE family toxin [Spirochaetaceae bacterium]|jgi:addiction module RelE/StbE family toxin|nr:type II toxin-antitoxin system RelE/ParE family toxin [Spirochaetaceae bacterium]